MLLRDMSRRRGRTLMVILAVAISTALLVSMLSVAGGLYRTLIESQEGDLQDIVVAAPGDQGMRNGHALAAEVDDVAGVRASVPVMTALFGEVSVTIPGKPVRLSPLMRGYVPGDVELFFTESQREKMQGGFQEMGDPHFQSGTYAGPWTGETIVNKGLAERHELSLGSRLNLTGSGITKEYRVAGIVDIGLTGTGIFKDVFMVFLHLSELQSLTGAGLGPSGETLDLVDETIVSLEQSVRGDMELVDGVVKELRDRYPFYNVATRETRLRQMEEQGAVARGFYLALGGVSMTIGLLFVATVMLMSVYERTNEIGMMRAIGISRRTIFKQVYAQALAIVLVGGLLGLVPGVLGTQALQGFIASRIGIAVSLAAFQPTVLAGALLMVVFLGSLVALYPAWKASRFNIISALREVK